jgi:hypothetical protein
MLLLLLEDVVCNYIGYVDNRNTENGKLLAMKVLYRSSY